MPEKPDDHRLDIDRYEMMLKCPQGQLPNSQPLKGLESFEEIWPSQDPTDANSK